jgi:hypothetical protein
MRPHVVPYRRLLTFMSRSILRHCSKPAVMGRCGAPMNAVVDDVMVASTAALAVAWEPRIPAALMLDGVLPALD